MGGAAAESGCVGLGLGQVEREGTHSVLCRTVRSPGLEPVCDGRVEAQADWSTNFWPQHTAGGEGLASCSQGTLLVSFSEHLLWLSAIPCTRATQ